MREGRPELEIDTDWTGHAKPRPWYGRYYADWDAAHPGAWVRGELVPGGSPAATGVAAPLAGTPIGSANTEPRCPKVCTT